MNTQTAAMTYTVADYTVTVYAGFESACNNETRVLLPGEYPVTFDWSTGGRATVKVPCLVVARHFVNRLMGASSAEDTAPMTLGWHYLHYYLHELKPTAGARTRGGLRLVAEPLEWSEVVDADEHRLAALGAFEQWQQQNREQSARYARQTMLGAPFVRRGASRWDAAPGRIVEAVRDELGGLTEEGRELARTGGYVTVLWQDGATESLHVDYLVQTRYPVKAVADAMIARAAELARA
jgi:hypothetical protein